MKEKEPIVTAKNLRKYYGDFQAVKGIDFKIYPGQCFGILGPNGAGKTTTVAWIVFSDACSCLNLYYTNSFPPAPALDEKKTGNLKQNDP